MCLQKPLSSSITFLPFNTMEVFRTSGVAPAVVWQLTRLIWGLSDEQLLLVLASKEKGTLIHTVLAYLWHSMF